MTYAARIRADQAQGAFWILAGLWALGWVWWAEHVGMAPCALCLWERWPYRVLILLGLVWTTFAGHAATRLVAAGVTLTLLTATGLALMHVGVEQHWWPSPLPECSAPHFVHGTAAQRLASMPLRPAKPCDAANRLFDWLPISMTSLDLIYAALLLPTQPILRRLIQTAWRNQ